MSSGSPKIGMTRDQFARHDLPIEGIASVPLFGEEFELPPGFIGTGGPVNGLGVRGDRLPDETSGKAGRLGAGTRYGAPAP